MKNIISILFVLVFLIQPANAQTDPQFVRPDSVLIFGNAVGISGEHVLIANSIPNFNSVWAMKNEGGVWNQVDEMEALQVDLSQVFGHSLAMYNDQSIVGALSFNYNGATNGGIAYVFERSGDDWTGAATLTPNDVEGQDEFGIAVGIDEDIAIAGSHKEDEAGIDSGAAYIFRRVDGSWIQEDKLLPDEGFENGRLGTSVSVSGDYAIAGSPLALDGTSVVGAAYIYERQDTAWVQVARLDADAPTIIESFGVDVVINGDVAMIGASGADVDGMASGAVYVYNRINDVWTFTQKFGPSDPQGSAQFGRSVDFDGDCAVVGSFNIGQAYIFTYNGTSWEEQAILTSSNGESGNGFGFDVSVSDGSVIVGTLGIVVDGIGGGGAFLYNDICGTVNTSVEVPEYASSHRLSQNFPNPFSQETVIEYALTRPAGVTISVYNVLGQEVARFNEGQRVSGVHQVSWNGRSDEGIRLPAGVYLYTLDVDGVQLDSRFMIRQ